MTKRSLRRKAVSWLVASGAALAVATQAPSASAIVDGEATASGDYPYVVRITTERKSGNAWLGYRYARSLCTGSLVTPSLVLTAAHCLYQGGIAWQPKEMKVDVGYKTTNSSTVKVSGIDEYQPGLFEDRSDGLFVPVHDIALLRLEKPVENRTLARIPDSYEFFPRYTAGSRVVQVGYGNTTWTDARKTASDVAKGPQKAATLLLSTANRPSSSRISATYPNFDPLPPEPPSGKCTTGDSGGPLLWRPSSGQPYLIGVFSTYSDSATANPYLCNSVRTDPASPYFTWLWDRAKPGVPPPSTPTSPPAATNKPPVAAFTYSRKAGANNVVALDGRSSSDPDGSVRAWAWSVGGKQVAAEATPTVALGAGTSKVVTLRVTDDKGAAQSISKTLSLPNRPPRLTASPADSVTVPSTTPTLTATGADDDADVLSYSYRVTGPSVDVSSGWVAGAWTMPAHRLDPGVTYTWTATVRDTAGATASVQRRFTVAMLPTAADVVATPSGDGYWQVDTFGHVFSYGDARYYGGLEDVGVHVTNIMGMARTPSGAGYWLVGRDGGVFAFGDAAFKGSLPGLNVRVSNVVGMAATRTGQGYWLVGSDGGVFAFGDAQFFGSMGGKPLNKPVNSIAVTASNGGYWLAADDGGIFAFGDAPFYGSMGGKALNAPVTDMDATSDGRGYWMTAEDGGVFAYGNAKFFGSMADHALNGRITGMSATPDSGGYWLTGCDGGVFAFGNATFHGSNPTNQCRGS